MTKRKLGITLIILSTILFLLIPVVPFLALTVKKKVMLSAGLAISAEIIFWIGGFIVGKELIQKYRSYLNPLRYLKKKDQS